MRLRDVVADVNAKVVSILTGDLSNPETVMCLGTGFIVSFGGWIATCCHVVSNQSRLWIAQTDHLGGFHNVAPVTMALGDPKLDVALLKIDTPIGGVVSLLKLDEEIHAGDSVAFIGYPEGNFSRSQGGLIVPNVRAGIISGVFRDPTGKWMLWVDAPVYPGNSGSPVFRTEDGVVVGMIASLRIDMPVPGLAIPRDLGQAILSAAIIRFLITAAEQGHPIGEWQTSD